jgi:hypothetical protein
MGAMTITRRAVLAAPLLGCANSAEARAPALHIVPDGAGAGMSWDDGAPLAALSELIAALEPGGEILVAAERGAYALSRAVDVSAGGSKGRTVRVRGVDSATGQPALAVLRGTRSPGETGASAFRLARGARNLHFSHFEFRDVGNGCFSISAPVSNLVIEDCVFENIYRFVENTAGSEENHASLRGFAVRRCRGRGVERGFSRVRYNSNDGLFEDCRAEGLPNEGGSIPAGCALDDRASSITYRRCVMENFQQWRAGEYWNGDGFSDEPDNSNIRYEACEARGSTDGGFDCKSSEVVLDACIAEDNKRNFRIWGERALLSNCISRRPNFRGRDVENADSCHLWFANEGRGRVLVTNLAVEDEDATPIIKFEHDVGRVEIRGVTIRSPRENWGEAADRIRAAMLRR